MKNQKKDFKKVTAALLIGRKGSVGFPGKNTFRISGKPLAEYPLLAARKSTEVERIFVSTDCPQIRKLGNKYKAEWIPRPARLATKDALGEDAFEHGYRVMQDVLAHERKELEFLVLLFANAPAVTGAMIDYGIEALRKNMEADSAVSVSIYNMWSPIRARRLDSQGYLQPFAPFKTFRNISMISCDRDSQGNVYFADMGVSVVRPRCLENLGRGLLPQKWMGRKILPIYSWGGCDIDYPWQIPQIQYWLKKNKLTN
jgi:CMP-N-acetylneuraminic acid synthetase